METSKAYYIDHIEILNSGKTKIFSIFVGRYKYQKFAGFEQSVESFIERLKNDPETQLKIALSRLDNPSFYDNFWLEYRAGMYELKWKGQLQDQYFDQESAVQALRLRRAELKSKKMLLCKDLSKALNLKTNGFLEVGEIILRDNTSNGKQYSFYLGTAKVGNEIKSFELIGEKIQMI